MYLPCTRRVPAGNSSTSAKVSPLITARSGRACWRPRPVAGPRP